MKIFHIGRYTHAQRGCMSHNQSIISFSISGLVSHNMVFPPTKCSKPLLCIVPPNIEIEFECNHKRENWAIVLDMPIATNPQNPENLIYKFDNKDILLPTSLQINNEHVAAWEREFVRMKEAFHSGTPSDILRCNAGVYNILRYFLDRKPETYYTTAASHLRWLIDNDTQAEASLEELSEKCGYSPDHLRLLFEKQYNQSPLEYRNRRRMTTAMNLICSSNLRVKEISAKLGFRQVSHFSAMFKNHFTFTPTHAIREFRKF